MDQIYKPDLSKLVNKYQVAGIQVAASKDGELFNSENAGYCNMERNTELEHRNIIRTASLSKMFTAVAVMQLVESGKIQLDEDINNQLQLNEIIRNPKYPDNNITPKMLLNHSSSLDDGYYINYTSASRRASQSPETEPFPTLDDVFNPQGSFHSENNWIDARPGEHLNYSNLAYIILGALIEQASGLDFNTYTNKFILHPLEMNTSSFNVMDLVNYPANNISEDQVVTNYDTTDPIQSSCEIHDTPCDCNMFGEICPIYRRVDTNGGVSFIKTDFHPELTGFSFSKIFPQVYPLGKNGAVFSPQGGLFSTAVDLTKFARALLNNGEFRGNKILQPESVAAMEQVSFETEQQTTGNLLGLFRKMGLGLHITTDLISPITDGNNEVVTIGHPGIAYGMVSGCYYNRDNDFAMVYLINGANTVQRGDYSKFYKVEEEVVKYLYNFVKEFI